MPPSHKSPAPDRLERGEWLLWALLPWPAVGAGLYLFRSALLAFTLYAAVCLIGAWRLGGLSVPLRCRLSWKVHLRLALIAHLLVIGGYALLGKWVMPVDQMQESLASVGITRASFFWLMPYFLLGNPFVEEMFWRGGVALGLNGRRFGSSVAAMLFGAWHWLAVSLFMPWWSALLATLGIMAVGFALAEVASGRLRIVGQRGCLGDAFVIHALSADLPLLMLLWLWLPPTP